MIIAVSIMIINNFYTNCTRPTLMLVSGALTQLSSNNSRNTLRTTMATMYSLNAYDLYITINTIAIDTQSIFIRFTRLLSS